MKRLQLDDADIATKLRRAITSGNLTYLSIAMNSSGKWAVAYANVEHDPIKMVSDADPFVAIDKALKGERTRRPAPKVRRNTEDLV